MIRPNPNLSETYVWETLPVERFSLFQLVAVIFSPVTFGPLSQLLSTLFAVAPHSFFQLQFFCPFNDPTSN